MGKIKENINLEFNIQDFWKVKKSLGVYYKWGCEAKGLYSKITVESDVKKLAESYEKHTGSGVKVKKTPDNPGTTRIMSDLKEPQDIDNYMSFMG